MFLVVLNIKIPDKVHHISQLPGLGLLTSPPGLCQFWCHFPLFVVYPVTTPWTLLASCEGGTLQVEYEAVMVIGMATVDTLYMSSSLLIMYSFAGVWGKQSSTADLTRFYRIALIQRKIQDRK